MIEDRTAQLPVASGPLEGVRVADFSQAAAGPFCAQHLGDMGAIVIKVEPPHGDMIRNLDDNPSTGVGSYFMGLNRNKQSMRLDLHTTEGQRIGQQLCARSDIVLENFRPGVMERLGLDYDVVRSTNPKVIYVSISAFGESGPLRDKPGMDIVVQAFAGLMGITGSKDSEPVKVGAPVADLVTGYAAAMGALAALYERERSGLGQRVSLSMLNVVMSLLSNMATGYLLSGDQPERMGSAHPQLVPYQAFKGSDGEYIVIGILNERFWKKLCDMLNADELVSDPKFAANRDRIRNRDELISVLSQKLLQKPVTEWERLCDEYDVPYTRVNTFDDLFNHPQVESESVVVKMLEPNIGAVPVIAQSARFSRTPASYRIAPRSLGADTESVLLDLGYDPSEIAEFSQRGVI